VADVEEAGLLEDATEEKLKAAIQAFKETAAY